MRRLPGAPLMCFQITNFLLDTDIPGSRCAGKFGVDSLFWKGKLAGVRCGLGEGSRSDDLVPNLESFATNFSVISGSEQVASRAECEAMMPCTSTKRWAWQADLNRRIRRSRSRVG